jgi:hypothetical protein
MQKINAMWECNSRLLDKSPGYAIRGPCLRVGECTSLPFRAKPGTASHLLCTLVLGPARRINSAPSPRHTTWLDGWMAGSLPACLPEHRIEHRLDPTCLAHDPTHMQLRVCSPARLSGRSVWVNVVIIGMAQPDLASFVEERRRQTTTATTRTKATTATTATATTTSTSTSQTTTTSTNRLHTHYCLVLPAPESSTLESSVLLRAFLTPLLRWRALPRPL